MTTTITLESIKRDASLFRVLNPVFEATFSITDGLVAGTVTISIPVDEVSEVNLVTKAREHLREVFLRLADEVVCPPDPTELSVVHGEEPTTEIEKEIDPIETADERRREEIAAAKLLIAVSLYANGTVPAADALPPTREDSEGVKDMERYMPEVTDIVMTSMPDGFGGVNKSLNLRVARWLTEGERFKADKDVVARIGEAVAAIGTEQARPRACQTLWNTLMSYTR